MRRIIFAFLCSCLLVTLTLMTSPAKAGGWGYGGGYYGDGYYGGGGGYNRSGY